MLDDTKPTARGHDASCAFGCAHDHGAAGGITRRGLLKLGVAGAAAAGLAGCVTTNRATGGRILTGFSTIQDDIALGRREHPNLVRQFGGEYDNPRLKRYVDQIGVDLARHAEYQEFPYQFTLVNSPVVNAFALPGGFCYVTRGLVTLASNEAELAGVVAHEIGHVNARHTAQRIAQSQVAQGLLLGAVLLTGESSIGELGGGIAGQVLRSFSREQEFEADQLGIRYMSRAGYEPDAMVGFLDTMRDQAQIEAKKRGLPPDTVDQANVNATHPRTIERVQRARGLAAQNDAPDQVINRDRYLETIDGMLYGDDPREGIVRGTEFTHPDMRFRFQVPDGFIIRNGKTRIVSEKPNVPAAIIFDAARRDSSDVFNYMTREWGRGIQISDARRLDINGLAAATATSRANGRDYRVFAIQGDGTQVFRFMFVSDPSRTRALERGFWDTAYSFRRLSRAEAGRVTPHVISVVPIRRGDTVATLSAGFPEGDFREEAFRVINDLKDGERLPASGRVKVVSGGAGV